MSLSHYRNVQTYRFVSLGSVVADRFLNTPQKSIRNTQRTRPVVATGIAMNSYTTASAETGSIKDGTESPTDLEQHCLLFPTYATRYSRSDSKDPLDWNIRIRGWAFSKRSSKRRRLAMSVARKLAGITKDNIGYRTLESRFGMFLANNTQGEVFSIQCVGTAKTSPMELTSDPCAYDSITDVLRSGSHSAHTPTDHTTMNDVAQQRKSMEESGDRIMGGERGYLSDPEDAIVESADNSNQEKRAPHATGVDGSKLLPGSGPRSPQLTSPEDHHGSRWAKSRAILSLAYRKYKPVVEQVAQSGSSMLKELSSSSSQGGSSPRTINTVFDRCEDGALPPLCATRTESEDSFSSQSSTYYDDLGHGSFPTVQICSKPSGHFDGTLRISHDEVMAFQKHGSRETHPRFLKMCAYHPEMRDHCHSTVNLIDPEGVSVISDIDDTIKETEITAGTRVVLRNTFLKDMQEVPGMASVYDSWWKQGAVFHYVSNSPWQLIPTLLEFFESHKFPRGSAHLRLHDSVLKAYFTPQAEHKLRSIRGIIRDFPQRKFILVGDSGEMDMEIYTELAAEFSKQIIKIFIRDITTGRLQKAESKGVSSPVAGLPTYEDVQTQQRQQQPKLPTRRSDPTLSTPPNNGRATDPFQAATERIETCNTAAVAIAMAAAASAATPTGARSTPADELMPGGPPSLEPMKTPMELWVERVENCRRRLGNEVLTLFVDAESLTSDQQVSEELEKYKGLSDCIDDDEDEKESDEEQRRRLQRADHIIQKTVDKLEEKLANI